MKNTILAAFAALLLSTGIAQLAHAASANAGHQTYGYNQSVGGGD
jgi:hypothetical protein